MNRLNLPLSGMNIFYDSALNKLVFDGRPLEGSIRFLGDMENVLYDRELSGSQGSEVELYYMFRDICRMDDIETVREKDLRSQVSAQVPRKLRKPRRLKRSPNSTK